MSSEKGSVTSVKASSAMRVGDVVPDGVVGDERRGGRATASSEMGVGDVGDG